MCTQHLDHIHPPTPFPHILLSPTGTNSWETRPVLPPVLWFCKRKKKWHFCLLKIAIQGVVTFSCIYVLSREFFHLLYFSPFYLSLLPMVILTGLKILYSFLYREYINHAHLLTSLFYPPPLVCDFPLTWPIFYNIAVFLLGLYSTCERKHVTFGFLNLTNFT
jgi:hypothetical protein